ncbi:TPA: hypothetical protein R1X36_000673 [Campylobacter upsaliensis]|nr:hypothetical protein [Campylobacter upsaliensis]
MPRLAHALAFCHHTLDKFTPLSDRTRASLLTSAKFTPISRTKLPKTQTTA